MHTAAAGDRPHHRAPDPAGPRALRKKAAHALVHELLDQGHSRRVIARHLGWGLNTVLRHASATRWQDSIHECRTRSSRLDPFKPCLERRVSEGCTSVTRLHRELLAESAPVSYGMVRARIATLRAPPSPAAPPPPTVRQVTGWLARHPTSLNEDDRTALKAVVARCPKLDAAAEHVRDLGEILTDRLGAMLPRWIDALTAGHTLERSSGGIEDTVNRIKKIRRQLYGRAEFELLRKMILLQ